jgi:hypothetical protein
MHKEQHGVSISLLASHTRLVSHQTVFLPYTFCLTHSSYFSLSRNDYRLSLSLSLSLSFTFALTPSHHMQTQATDDHILTSTRRLLDLIARLSPEYNLFAAHAHVCTHSWRALPSAVTWAGACAPPNKLSGACLALRSLAVSLLRVLASAPCTANHVQDALRAAFTALCDVSSNKADDMNNSVDVCVGDKNTLSAVCAHADDIGGASKLLHVLAPTLAVGGALDALFLRENLGDGATFAGTLLRDDVVDAFLRACDCVLAAEWRGMCVLGETMRARMMKALWELLASQVCVCVYVCVWM